MNSMQMQFQELLAQIDQSLVLSEVQLHQLHLYYENILEWNSRMNLTTITEENEVYTKHFLDSYSIFISVPRETISTGSSIIDVGSGAGFPGIPLAIALPETNITLMDSLGKRIRFLEDTARKLGLKNITCIHARAEDLARNPEHREQYDMAVARAVANLSTLVEYCIPFLRTGGKFIAYKSGKIDENDELETGKKAAKTLGAQLTDQRRFLLPGTEYKRSLIVFQKTKTTPKIYPRKSGTPSRNPLK